MAQSVYTNMFHTINKIRKRINEIEPYRYRDSFQPTILIAEDKSDSEKTRVLPQDKLSYRKLSRGDTIFGKNRYYWIKP